MPLKLYEKEKILDSCFEVFVENGYMGTTTAMLADAAGISKALIFHHFGSKKALYLCILGNCFNKMSSVVNKEDMETYTDYFEARENSGFLRIEYFKDNPKVAKMFLEAFYNTPAEIKDEISDFSRKLSEMRGTKDDSRGMKLNRLFAEIPLRKGVSREEAYEFTDIIMQYFNHKYLADMVDENLLTDEEFWKEFKHKKSKFLEIIRYGIENQDE